LPAVLANPPLQRPTNASVASLPLALAAERQFVSRTGVKLNQALEEFRAYLRRGGDEQVPRTARAGIERMMAFYRDVRADDVDLQSDGDMLLFQWGAYDWGGGEMFEIDITRQLIACGGEDEDIWQLHLTYRFSPSEELRAIGKGNSWCPRPDDTLSLQLFMGSHPAMTAVGATQDGQVSLDYECAG
jgi:hypothetical protein